MTASILRNFAWHIALTPGEQEQALALFQQKTVKKSGLLLRPGEIERDLYFVEQGCLRMYYLDIEGKEHNICFYPENWWAADLVLS